MRVPVRLWSGAQDTDTPPAHARWLATAIPGASLRQFPDEGHLSLIQGATARWSTGSPSTCIGAGDQAPGRLATEVAATEDNAVSPEPLGDRVQRPHVRCGPLRETDPSAAVFCQQRGHEGSMRRCAWVEDDRSGSG